MTRVKWFGKVTVGKLGVMYLGDTPFRMKELSAGVRPRFRKSARNPSSDIRIVVGANRQVPLDTKFCVLGGFRDARYAPYAIARKRMTMSARTIV